MAKQNLFSSGRTATKQGASKDVTFSFYAPLAKEVLVGGTFNEWNPSKGRLKKSTDGTWKGIFSLKPGRYEYRYRIDGRWENDQGRVPTVANPFGSANNVIEVK